MKDKVKQLLIVLILSYLGGSNIQAQVRDAIVIDSLRKKINQPILVTKNFLSTNSIKGFIIDSTSQKAVDYVTVNLKMSTGESIRSTLSRDDGSFVFEKVAIGKYSIVIASVGYHPSSISLTIDSTKQVWDLGRILLSKESKQLREVAVIGNKPLITSEVDRIVYDVQADPESKVESVLDMMRKVPLLSIDGDDKIKFKGGDNYKILIDGQPSSLIARNPEDVFKSMPAINIVKIEIITTPPAKYDSEGLAGIINIITNKKIGEGYNASIGLKHNLISGPGTSASLTARSKKIGISLNGGVDWNLARYSPFSTSRHGNLEGTQFEQSGTRAFQGHFGFVRTEVSYEIDTLNLITTFVGFNDNGGITNLGSLNSQYNQNGLLEYSYRLKDKWDYYWGGYDLGVNYQLKFKKNKGQLLTASYQFNSNKDQTLAEIWANEKVNYLPSGTYRQQNNAGTDEQTIQLDYIHPLKKLNVEGGLKAILRDNFSDYGRQEFDQISETFIPSVDNTNRYNYKQNVFGFYNSYSVKLEAWTIKAGLRLEKTGINADFISSSNKLKADYSNFIPSVAMQREFKNQNSLNLGYTQRIQRPGIWQLNPYKDKRDKFIQSGNQDLLPVLSHNFEFSYNVQKKGSITSSLSYSFANNTIQQVSYLIGANRDTTNTTFMNIGKNKSLGLNIFTTYPFNDKFSFRVNSGISRKWMEGMINNILFKRKGFEGNVNVNAIYKFDNDWRAGMNVGYSSPSILLQGQWNAYYYSSLSLSKDFLKRKASLSVSINNPFEKMRSMSVETITPEFTQVNYYNNFYRQVNFSFNYKFGKMKDGIKKSERSIKNDDVSNEKVGY